MENIPIDVIPVDHTRTIISARPRGSYAGRSDVDLRVLRDNDSAISPRLVRNAGWSGSNGKLSVILPASLVL